MHEFWHDFVKPNYGENAKLCYMDTDSFIVHVKTEDINKDIAEDVKTRFDVSNYELGWSLPKGKKQKKSNWINERRIRWKNHERIYGLRAKRYSNLTNKNNEDKKAKNRKKCVIERKLKLEDYKE